MRTEVAKLLVIWSLRIHCELRVIHTTLMEGFSSGVTRFIVW